MKYPRVVGEKKPDGTFDLVDLDPEEYIAECLIDLINAGLDEQAHFLPNGWEKLDNDDLERALSSHWSVVRILEHSRKGIIKALNQALNDRREEDQRNAKEDNDG